ncbi:hypothetical protein SDJN02_25487, partial [Cucurbita argyrosperma subsp. argyrosperma]
YPDQERQAWYQINGKKLDGSEETHRLILDIFPTSVKKTRKKTSCLGIPLCFCWCKYHIYDHANARSRWFKPRTSIRSVFLQMLSDERSLEQSPDLLYQVAIHQFMCTKVRILDVC